MKVVIVTAVFPPETVVSSQTSAQIAHALSERGHQVRVIAPFPNRPAGQLYPGYSRRLFQRDSGIDELEVIRCFNLLSSRSGMLNRFMENVSFGITGGLAFLGSAKPDVLYANTWPTFAAGLLVLLAGIRRVPIVISVQDMYPEQLIAQRRIKRNSWAARLLYWIENRIANHVNGVVLISESLKIGYQNTRKISPDCLHVIPNWAERDSIVADDREAAVFRTRYAIPQTDFTVLYGGNIAFAAGVETIVESFHFLVDIQDIHLVIAGEGSNLADCKQIAETIDTPRIYFHTPWPRAENSMALSAADLLVLPTRGMVSLAAMPSKLISYMLAARPIIALALPQSELAQVIEIAGCGWVVEPDMPELLAEKIREVMALPVEERDRYGLAGRNYALQHLTKEVCLPQVVDLLERVAT